MKAAAQSLLLLFISLLATTGAWAQTTCWKSDELQAEAEVRTGIHLREIYRRCAMEFSQDRQTLTDWYAFDAAQATNLQRAVARREAALKRLFPNPQAKAQWETDAVVAVRAPQRPDAGTCKSARDVLRGLQTGGWPAFQKQAGLQLRLLRRDVAVCR